MATLGNPQHERFAQEFHRLVWTGGKPKESRVAAYKLVGYETSDDYVADNARKLANRKDVKARLAELRDYASKLAGIDAGWALVKLKRRVDLVDEYNVSDYLTDPVAAGAPRYFDISKASQEQLARLNELELHEEIIDAGEDTLMKVRKTKIKGYGDITGPLTLMAKIAGWLAPEKVAHSGGLTLESLVGQSFEKPPAEPKKEIAA